MGRSDVQTISWQEFKTSLLDKRVVARVEVANRESVKVYVTQPRSRGVAAPSESASSENGGGSWRGDASSATLHDGVYRYRFSIGSVDTFERKLEDAQSAAGVAADRFIPVTYVSELSWGSELLRLAPTALLLGAYLWFTRRQLGGGLGGGGGMGGRGIFSVGKANVTTLDASKQKRVMFADVAGCDEAKTEACCLARLVRLADARGR